MSSSEIRKGLLRIVASGTKQTVIAERSGVPVASIYNITNSRVARICLRNRLLLEPVVTEWQQSQQQVQQSA
jgi:hypothetical protein